MKIARTSRSAALLCAAALLCLAALFAGSAGAEDAPRGLDANLTAEEFQAALGRLSDEQVRDLLIQEFAARRAAAPEPAPASMETFRTIGDRLTTNGGDLLRKWPELGGAFGAVGARLSEAGGVGLAGFALALSLAAGFAARHFWRRRAARRQTAIAERNVEAGSYGSLSTILDAATFLLIDLSSVAAFALTAMAVLFLGFHNPEIRYFASSYIAVVAVVLIVKSMVNFMFPGDWPQYRLVALSDGATRLVQRLAVGLAGLWMFETTTTEVMARFGAPAGTPDLFSLLLALLWIATALGGVALVRSATTDLTPPRSERGLASVLTRNWARIMSVALIFIWILFTGGALLTGDANTIAWPIFQTQLLLIGFWMVYRILIHYLRAQSMNDMLKDAIRRAARTSLLTAGILIVVSIWGLGAEGPAAGGGFARAVKGAVSIALTGLVGWALWDFIRTLIDVRTAKEAPRGEADEGADGEGGTGASRSATLLPLLRTTAMTLIGMSCVFTALSSLGFNVAPLIAGAGVVGLAVGFGAQTLVKDVVSGIFFLIDDAFRRGEYIDLGSAKGTVERISIRSLQLRHHLGAVHTIPFGDISTLTNYSRDWVIMKLELRLTFDTDPKLVKKIVKRIGEELMQDELLGVGLLEAPKSQGVVQMEDSAMLLSIKFKTVPGKQFPIRRELLHRIREAFEEADIRFANREVTVRVHEDATPDERRSAIAAAASRGVEEAQKA